MAPSRPTTQQGDLARLPAALEHLIAQRRWVVWRWIKSAHNSKWTKVPYRSGCPSIGARSNDAETWSSYEEALAGAQADQADGIGFMLQDSDVAAFDIDQCRDAHTGEIVPWAWTLINEAKSYTEITVSGTGLRIIGRASGSHIHRKHEHESGSVETYRKATRFIVITGLQLEGSPSVLRDLDRVIDDHVARMEAAKAARSAKQQVAPHFDFSAANDSDLPAELEYLIRTGVPVGKRSQQFHRVVACLKRRGLTIDEVVDRLKAHPGGIAAKFIDRLRVEVERSYAKAEEDRRHEHGSSTHGTDAELRVISATPYVWISPEHIRPREWLYGRHLIRKFVSATIAPGGIGKSSLVIAEALAMVSGKPLLGTLPVGQLAVWLWNLEDPKDEIARRIQAAAKHYELAPADIGTRLFVDSGRDQQLILAQTTRAGTVICRPIANAVTNEIQARNVDVLIIDPFVSCHQVSENDNTAIDMVAKEWATIAEKSNCAVELVHHTRKMLGVESEVTTESSRGGKALTDACRSVRTVNRMTKDEGDRAGVESHRVYFRTYSDKSNLAPPPEKSDWFRLQGVDLGNGPLGIGDNVGVVVEWRWPDPMSSVSVADLRATQQLVKDGQWRENSQAKNWVGNAIASVLRLDLENKAHRSKIKALLKVWLAAGMFVIVNGKDERGNDRPFIEVGEWASD